MVTDTTTVAEPIGRIRGIPLYANGTAPGQLLTKSGLEAQRLRPAPGQAPAAYIRVRYYKTLAALYDPALAVAAPERTIGQDWAYRIRRTCPKCGVRRPYVVYGDECGHCHDARQRTASRLHKRTCRNCGKVGKNPYATDKEYPFSHRCPPCRALRKVELAEKFEVGLLASQVCPDCGETVMSRTAALRFYRQRKFWGRKVCDPCKAKQQREAEQRRQDAVDAELRREQARRDQVAELEQWARDVLADPGTVILDTETTGLDDSARIIEISITTAAGDVLLDTLLNPGEPIPAEATGIHGITDAMVAGAPSFGDVLLALRNAIYGKRVLIYNDEFDVKRLGHELNLHHDGTGDLLEIGKKWLTIHGAAAEDAMRPYSTWYGEWSEWHGNYRWQRLGGGHRALGDCRAVVHVLQSMAKGSSDEDDEVPW